MAKRKKSAMKDVSPSSTPARGAGPQCPPKRRDDRQSFTVPQLRSSPESTQTVDNSSFPGDASANEHNLAFDEFPGLMRVDSMPFSASSVMDTTSSDMQHANPASDAEVDVVGESQSPPQLPLPAQHSQSSLHPHHPTQQQQPPLLQAQHAAFQPQHQQPQGSSQGPTQGPPAGSGHPCDSGAHFHDKQEDSDEEDRPSKKSRCGRVRRPKSSSSAASAHSSGQHASSAPHTAPKPLLVHQATQTAYPILSDSDDDVIVDHVHIPRGRKTWRQVPLDRFFRRVTSKSESIGDGDGVNTDSVDSDEDEAEVDPMDSTAAVTSTTAAATSTNSDLELHSDDEE